MSSNPTVLKIGSHNIRGGLIQNNQVSPKAQALAYFWAAQHLDIIFIQEHKVADFFMISSLCGGPLRPWKAYFNHHKPTSSGNPSCAIFIRRRLISSNLIKIQENSLSKSSNGRLISLNITWGGHRLQLACMHLPNTPAEQRDFIDTLLVPLANTTNGNSLHRKIWGGDFNFVHNPSLDRIQRVTENGVTTLQRPMITTTPIGTLWSTRFSNLCDLYRQKHPTSRDMSRFDPVSTSAGHGGSARLDRFYISDSLESSSPYSRPCSTTIVPNTISSDHLLVTMDLVARVSTSLPTPAQAPPRWRKRRRYKLMFKHVPSLVEEYETKLVFLFSQAPLDQRQLLEWYPSFKLQWTNLIVETNIKYCSLRNAAPAHTTADLQLAFSHLQAASNAELSTVLQTYTAAHQANTTAIAVYSSTHSALLARYNIHENEVPNKNLTHWIAPCSHTTIQAIKSPSGQLVTNPVRCANIFAKKFAAVSSLPATSTAAQQEVLTYLEQSNLPKIDAAEAAILGSGVVTVEEVNSAIKHTRPGTAPGTDGIPIAFYHLSRTILAPLLAKVYSAAHSINDAPASFCLGAISPLYKLDPTAGDLTDTQFYRPITLLDVDYRILAKVLATRYKPIMPKIIHPSQSAFISGRNIGDCNWLPQFLAPLLARSGQSAALLLCDIAKAYDTVDREFLWQIMALMGVGDDFLKWMKLLHRNTKACAVVRGYLGDAASILAGVRQGCPLANMLFSFVTHALILFLQPLEIGIKINNKVVPNTLFADNLRALAALFENYQCPKATQLLNALVIFGNASNLRPSVPKLECLLLGAIPANTPSTVTSIGNFKLVPLARSLGLQLPEGTAFPSNSWDLLATKFDKRCKLISQCGLSMFGRSRAISSYSNSALYYVAEHAPLPTAAVLSRLSKTTSNLINRNVGPVAPGRGFYGIKPAALAGPPTKGGFGLIPIESHIVARHAKVGLRLLFDPADVTWIHLGRQLLATTCPFRDHGGGNSRLAAVSFPTSVDPATLPSPLSFLLKALYQLPPLIVNPSLAPGPWCYGVPLWNNKFIVATNPATGTSLGTSLNSLDSAAGFYSTVSTLHTIGDALTCYGRLSAIPLNLATSQTHALYRAVANDCFGPETSGVWTNPNSSGLPELSIAKPRLFALLKSIRPDWLSAAHSLLAEDEHAPVPAPKPSMDDALSILLGNLGWMQNQKFIPTAEYTVKWGTRQHFETTAAFTAQLNKFKNFTHIATPVGNDTTRLQRLYSAFKRAWYIRWDRKHTEILWLLAHDALPTAARLHTTDTCSCCPTITTPGLLHHFWSCSVSEAIRNEFWQQLSSLEGFSQSTLRRHHLWLLECPLPSFYQPLWPVVALAALNAMDSGRRSLFRLSRNSSTASIPTVERAAIRNGIAAFWKLLAQFAANPQAPQRWSSLPEDHPIIHWNSTAAKLELSPRLLQP
ncbi:hypothetical protein Ndes2526A_g03960 [Nannochloris sp. 'desiccata']